MNKFLTLLTFLIASSVSLTALAMQEPTTTESMTYSKPFKTKNHLKICAFANGSKIGSVKYRKEENGYWYVSKLSVDMAYRKTKNKVGFNLFSKCLADIQTKKPKRIHWFVTRIKDDSPDLKVLTAIYKQMVINLRLEKNLIIEPYDTMTFMALNFNNGVTA